MNRCTLTKLAVAEDGTGAIVEERDLRGEREVHAANAGKIEIRRRAAPTTFRKGLQAIAKFAERAGAAEVTKVLG